MAWKSEGVDGSEGGVMDNDDYDDESGSRIHAMFESVNDDFLEFDKIPIEDRPCSSPDVCVFLYLDKKFPTDRKAKMVSAAEHDQIWLRMTDEQIAQLTETDVLYLTRCGVFHDDDTDSLGMFV